MEKIFDYVFRFCYNTPETARENISFLVMPGKELIMIRKRKNPVFHSSSRCRGCEVGRK